MAGIILSVFILLIALYGYYLSVRPSQLEKDLKKNGMDYECFRCKEKFSISTDKCPKCTMITIYGTRKKKFWLIIPIAITWLFMLSKFWRGGMF